MHRWIILLLILTVFQSHAQNSVAITQVIDEVKRAVAFSTTSIGCQIPPLKQVELTFQGVHNQEVNGKIDLYIFSFGKSIEKEKTQKLHLVLKQPIDGTAPASQQTPSLSKELASMIKSAAEGVCKSRVDFVDLYLDKLVVELSFVVKDNSTGGAKFELIPVNLSLGGSLSDKAVHTVKIEFSKGT